LDTFHLRICIIKVRCFAFNTERIMQCGEQFNISWKFLLWERIQYWYRKLNITAKTRIGEFDRCVMWKS
jgi:hypothetical protein